MNIKRDMAEKLILFLERRCKNIKLNLFSCNVKNNFRLSKKGVVNRLIKKNEGGEMNLAEDFIE